MAADPLKYEYPWPLAGYEDAEPLPETIQEDKSIYNPPTGQLSEAYKRFTSGVENGRRGGFDCHIYYYQFNEEQTKFARALYERIRREFPELRIYKFWDKPIGPHMMAMFEVNLLSPTEFGAFVPWLVINRGPLSVLVHPNTENETMADMERNHTQRATWMGAPLPIWTQMFSSEAIQKEREKKQQQQQQQQ